MDGGFANPEENRTAVRCRLKDFLVLFVHYLDDRIKLKIVFEILAAFTILPGAKRYHIT